MLFHQDDATVIHKLRVTCPPEDRFQELRRLERALALVAPGTNRFPSSAIIYMRKLQVADPVRGGSIAAWSTAVQKTIDQLLQEAERPAQGPVSSSAPAVWFMDKAEWLACLARDWLDGQLGHHWWWQTILAANDHETAVVMAWQEAVAFMPVALEHLARRGAIVPFARRLSGPSVQTLLLELGQAFALPVVMAAGQPDAHQAPGIHSATRTRDRASADGPSRSERKATERRLRSPFITPPWSRVAPECRDADLTKAQAMFVAAGLALRRRPWLLRDPGQVEALGRWWRSGPVRDAEIERTLEPEKGYESDSRATPLERTAMTPEKPAPETTAEAVDAGSSAKEIAPRAIEEATAYEGMPETARGEVAASAAPGSESRAAKSPAAMLSAEESPAARASPVEDESILEDVLPEWRTRWGGLFYLANLLLYLELYHDFGAHEQPDLPLPFWDLLALIGRRLIGPDLEDDPIWALLATWSGREEDEPVGQAFEAPEAWQLPPAWLDLFESEEEWTWNRDDERIRIWHPTGFWIADLPRREQTLSDWREENDFGEADRRLVRGTCPVAEGQSALDRWLDWLLAYMSARLRLALGLDQEADLTTYLFQHDARLTDSGTEIDVYFSLTTLPVAVRYAGLDRDPGWIPASGRRLTFHFEIDDDIDLSSANPGHVDPIIQ